MKKMYEIKDNIFVKIDLADYKKEVLSALQNRIQHVNKEHKTDDSDCECFYVLACKIAQERVETALSYLCGKILNLSFWLHTEPLVEELQEDLYQYAKNLI